MVRELIAPPNRIILFLQQSSVEWCNSMFLQVVQEADPGLQRTILVTSKFDNRLKARLPPSLDPQPCAPNLEPQTPNPKL